MPRRKVFGGVFQVGLLYVLSANLPSSDELDVNFRLYVQHVLFYFQDRNTEYRSDRPNPVLLRPNPTA